MLTLELKRTLKVAFAQAIMLFILPAFKFFLKVETSCESNIVLEAAFTQRIIECILPLFIAILKTFNFLVGGKECPN